jgi:homoserine O-succinyltransferase
MPSRRGVVTGDGGRHGDALRIALVNAMPDRALFETERQFTAMIGDAGAASGGSVRIELYSLDGIARSNSAHALLAQRYRTLDTLLDGPDVDAVIVTGAAPSEKALENEMFWPHLVRLFDWASRHAGSLLVSCLAAHAAVLHLDGISRHRLPQKCSGVFPVDAADPHPLLSGAPSRWRTPHSRYHTIDEAALRSAGYTVLSRSDVIGIDAFAREYGGTLLLGLNGHPEYASDTLLREYRRDVAQTLSGASAVYPELPHSVLDAASERRLHAFRTRAGRDAGVTMRDFPATLVIRADACTDVSGGARHLFAAWIDAVRQRRPSSRRPCQVPPVLRARAAGR